MGKKLTTEEFITKARIVHGNKYDYSKAEYTAYNAKTTFGCKIHGEFLQSPERHLLSKTCCPICDNKQIALKNTGTLAQFLTTARKVHGNKYDYSKAIYVNTKTKLTVICPEHGEFTVAPNNHTSRKANCPACYVATKGQCNILTLNQFIINARLIHGDTYDYSDVEYINTNTRITICCKKHGNFNQTPTGHVNHKQGCPMCGMEMRYTTLDQFISKAKSLHKNKYDYSKVEYIHCNTKVTIICPIHGEFSQTPSNHNVAGCGCPMCASTQKYSNKSIEWLESIIEKENIYIQHALNGGEYRIPGTRFSADGYCKNTNTIYEFQGDAFHGNPNKYKNTDCCHPRNKDVTACELYQKTIERENKIKSLGFNLIVMWESDWNKLRSK